VLPFSAPLQGQDRLNKWIQSQLKFRCFEYCSFLCQSIRLVARLRWLSVSRHRTPLDGDMHHRSTRLTFLRAQPRASRALTGNTSSTLVFLCDAQRRSKTQLSCLRLPVKRSTVGSVGSIIIVESRRLGVRHNTMLCLHRPGPEHYHRYLTYTVRSSHTWRCALGYCPI
jgi:hypothetical protein